VVPRIEGANSVGPALIDEAAEGEPDLGAKERVIDPTLRLVDVEFGVKSPASTTGTPLSSSSAAWAERRSNHLSLKSNFGPSAGLLFGS
jgi:hypothetical protein